MTPKERERDRRLQRTYGITQRVYRTMLTTQNGGCAICSRAPRAGKNLHVDHDHKTGRVRGLLCFRCNRRLLGRGLEVPELHEAAAKYLRSTVDWRKAA